MEIEQRPWGIYEVLLDTENCKVKEITVDPGQKLSYQYHTKRREQWTVTKGTLTIVLDDEKVWRMSIVGIVRGCRDPFRPLSYHNATNSSLTHSYSHTVPSLLHPPLLSSHAATTYHPPSLSLPRCQFCPGMLSGLRSCIRNCGSRSI